MIAFFGAITRAVLLLFDRIWTPFRRAQARSATDDKNRNYFCIFRAPARRAARLCAQVRSAPGYIEGLLFDNPSRRSGRVEDPPVQARQMSENVRKCPS